MPPTNQRPNKLIANNTFNNMRQLLSSLSTISNQLALLEQDIPQKAAAVVHNLTMQEMAAIDVETLNADKRGLRISALRDVGIHNFAQLYEIPEYGIYRINGIGEQSAPEIKRLANEMYREISSTTRIRFNIQQSRPDEEALIMSLFRLQKCRPVCSAANSMIASVPHINQALQDAEQVTSGAKWLFSSKRKKENALAAYNYIVTLLTSNFYTDACQLISQYNEIINCPLGAAIEDFKQNLIAYYTLLESLGITAAKQVATGIPEALALKIDTYPLDLTYMKATLPQYQIFGAKYALCQKKALLGDEMGLGKTIQALAVMADLKARGHSHFLVVCPASVLVNWQKETEKHSKLNAIIIHGTDKLEELEWWKDRGGVGITNFESLGRMVDLLDRDIGVLVVDEAHYVKNPAAQRTKAIIKASQRATRTLYMTGTPLENRVDEMCFLVSCLRPDIAEKLSTMKTFSATQKFKSELSPVYLRRLRKDVAYDLPDLIENEDWVEQTKEEASVYRNYVYGGNFMAMRRNSWYSELAYSSKEERLKEICTDALEDGLKILIFSFFRKTLQRVYELFEDSALGPITGDVPSNKRQAMVDEFTESETKNILVAQVQAGGVGLNIQAASVVIFCEPQIKPSLESQALSRAYRRGQSRNVLVHRLLCDNTIDERMMEMLSRKQNEFDTYAEESEMAEISMDSAWIKDVIASERARLGITGAEEITLTLEEDA